MSARLNFRQIEAFRAVMLTGTTIAAANMLNTTQPSISRSLAQIQSAAKLKLFELDRGRRFASTLFLNGGQGAGAKGDGLPALSFPSNLANTPIEVIESQAPIRIVRRALRRGTGGAGKTRGGDGQVFELDLLADEPVAMSFMADRLRTAAPGMLGGEPGATGRLLLDGAPIDPRETLVAAPGSRLTLETPGGGGFGSATERTG